MCAMNPRLLRPIQTGFTPRKIADLALWLDASDSSTITTSTGVSEWRDKSGKGNNFAQTTGNNQPTVTTAGQNGLNTLTFNGSSQKLLSTSASLSLSSTHSVFAVVNPRIRKISAILVGSINTELFYGDGSSFSGSKFGAYGTARAVYGGGTITTGVYQVFTAICAGATMPTDLSMYTNGTGGTASVQTAGTAPGVAMSAFLGIGAFESLQYWDGSIAEIVVYTRTLGTTERQAVERWLGKKWGITVA